jgi:hypothetical protein
MRFINPAQTLSEYKHRKMPVYETFATIGAGLGSAGAAAIPTLGSIGSTALKALPAVASAAPSILGMLGIGKHKASVPTFNPQQALAFQQQEFNQMSPQALGFGSQAYNQAAQEGIDFSKLGTQANIANQEAVTPGSQAQREAALNQINAYIQGQVPQDVQQNIQRQVAQGLGGGFNVFSGGGMAPQNFARNIGQTSVGLSQFGLSAAPTWQSLANTMVVNPSVGLSAGLSGIGQGASLASYAANLGNQLAENQYTSAFNQYGGTTTQNQGQMQLLNSLGSGIGSIASALDKSGFLNTLAKTGFGALPATGLGSDAFTSTGNYQPPI